MLRYELEIWSTQRKNDTSNWKEVNDITVQVRGLAEEHKLDNGKLFILTDNQVFGGCFYKGNSNSRKLNELMLRLRLVEMITGCILRVIHVAGTIMKRAGIDGLSLLDILEGMRTGQNPSDFIMMNELYDERSGGRVVSWINSW